MANASACNAWKVMAITSNEVFWPVSKLHVLSTYVLVPWNSSKELENDYHLMSNALLHREAPHLVPIIFIAKFMVAFAQYPSSQVVR